MRVATAHEYDSARPDVGRNAGRNDGQYQLLACLNSHAAHGVP